MNVKIQDLKDVTINGVKTLCTKSLGSYKETFFEWTAFPMAVDFKSTQNMVQLRFVFQDLIRILPVHIHQQNF